jgi:hypothetical protein
MNVQPITTILGNSWACRSSRLPQSPLTTMVGRSEKKHQELQHAEEDMSHSLIERNGNLPYRAKIQLLQLRLERALGSTGSGQDQTICSCPLGIKLDIDIKPKRPLQLVLCTRRAPFHQFPKRQHHRRWSKGELENGSRLTTVARREKERDGLVLAIARRILDHI